MDMDSDETIIEPYLDASQCSFHTDSSAEIKYYYKLRYPTTYRIPSAKILELLDNKQVYADLQNSVKSFVDCARKAHERDQQFSDITTTEITEVAIHDKKCRKFKVNSEKNAKKGTDMFDVPSTSTDFSVYDSVHSIKVPLRTYETSCRHSTHQNSKPERGKVSSVETIGPTTGLVFERIEKSFPLPVNYKPISHKGRNNRKEKSQTITLTNNEVEHCTPEKKV